MDDNFSPRVKDVITYSKEEALRLGHDFIGTEHLILGILRDGNGEAIEILNSLSVEVWRERGSPHDLPNSYYFALSRKGFNISIGIGKMVVELFCPAISLRVCR